MKSGIIRTILLNLGSIAFHISVLSGAVVFTCGRTDGRTDGLTVMVKMFTPKFRLTVNPRSLYDLESL